MSFLDEHDEQIDRADAHGRVRAHYRTVTRTDDLATTRTWCGLEVLPVYGDNCGLRPGSNAPVCGRCRRILARRIMIMGGMIRAGGRK